jgi:hypothetical protein
MDKPDRVEVGQWYIYYNGVPWRVEEWSETTGEAASLYAHEKTRYLGSADHPEPSEWMIETLLAHAKEVAPKAADRYGGDTVRHIINGGTTMSMDPRQGDAMNRSVLSLYRILRSLGKW